MISHFNLPQALSAAIVERLKVEEKTTDYFAEMDLKAALDWIESDVKTRSLYDNIMTKFGHRCLREVGKMLNDMSSIKKAYFHSSTLEAFHGETILHRSFHLCKAWLWHRPTFKLLRL